MADEKLSIERALEVIERTVNNNEKMILLTEFKENNLPIYTYVYGGKEISGFFYEDDFSLIIEYPSKEFDFIEFDDLEDLKKGKEVEVYSATLERSYILKSDLNQYILLISAPKVRNPNVNLYEASAEGPYRIEFYEKKFVLNEDQYKVLRYLLTENELGNTNFIPSETIFKRANIGCVRHDPSKLKHKGRVSQLFSKHGACRDAVLEKNSSGGWRIAVSEN